MFVYLICICIRFNRIWIIGFLFKNYSYPSLHLENDFWYGCGKPMVWNIGRYLYIWAKSYWYSPTQRSIGLWKSETPNSTSFEFVTGHFGWYREKSRGHKSWKGAQKSERRDDDGLRFPPNPDNSKKERGKKRKKSKSK